MRSMAPPPECSEVGEEPAVPECLMPYWVYVLRSSSAPRRYVGQTDDLARRLARHSDGLVLSTAPYRPWRLVHSEHFMTRSEAMRRERFLKSGQGREFLDRLERELNRQSPPAAD
jgi:putative endonuclease